MHNDRDFTELISSRELHYNQCVLEIEFVRAFTKSLLYDRAQNTTCLLGKLPLSMLEIQLVYEAGCLCMKDVLSM